MKKLKLKQYVNILGSLFLGLTGLMQMAEAQQASLPRISGAQFRECTQLEDAITEELQTVVRNQVSGSEYATRNLRLASSIMVAMGNDEMMHILRDRLASPETLTANERVRYSNQLVEFLHATGLDNPTAEPFVVCPVGYSLNPAALQGSINPQDNGGFYYGTRENEACTRGAEVSATVERTNTMPTLYSSQEGEDHRSIYISTSVHRPVQIRYRNQLLNLEQFVVTSNYDLRTGGLSTQGPRLGVWDIVISNGRRYTREAFVNTFLPARCDQFHSRSPVHGAPHSDGTGGGSGNGVFSSGVSALPASPAAPAS